MKGYNSDGNKYKKKAILRSNFSQFTIYLHFKDARFCFIIWFFVLYQSFFLKNVFLDSWNEINSMGIIKRYFKVDQHLTRHFVYHIECLSSPFLCCKIITPFNDSMIFHQWGKGLKFKPSMKPSYHYSCSCVLFLLDSYKKKSISRSNFSQFKIYSLFKGCLFNSWDWVELWWDACHVGSIMKQSWIWQLSME